MNQINQTNRTLLLEEINPEKLDFLTILGDVKGIDSLSDDKMREVKQSLECRSYEEFEEKFAPSVFSFYDANTQTVRYVLRKPEHIPASLLTEIPLNRQNDFMKMLFTLLETKKAQGVLNVDFGFENLLDLISPKKVMEDIRQVRKEIRYNYGKYMDLSDGDPAKLDLGDKLNLLFEEASNNYNNVMAMLPLAIEDIKTRLLLGGGEKKKDNAPIALGMLALGEKGELQILEAPKEESTALVALDDQRNQSLMETIKEDYQSVNEAPTDYVQSLVVRTFCPLSASYESKVEVETEVSNYNAYLEFYKKSKDAFIQVVKPLAEKLLGIKMFFDQYKVKTKGMQPRLLVANLQPEMLAKSSNLPALLTYLNTTNSKNTFEDTIWQAILPNISLSQGTTAKLRRERFAGNARKESNAVNSLETLTVLLDVLKDYRVETFFSFETREETTFHAVACEGVEKFITRCEPLVGKSYSEFAIPCFPNFTVIPKNKSGVLLDKKMCLTQQDTVELSEEKEDVMQLWMEGVYIGAAFVAAGFVAACQCPEFLKDRFKKRKINLELPGVRYDVEAGNHALCTTTTMPKEITGFTNTIKNQINSRNFGFVFASENATLDGLPVTNILVYKARNLLYDTDHSTYESIYKTRVTTYLERILRFSSGDFKQENIVTFFSNHPASQKSRWLASKDCVNAIMAEGDSIDYVIEEATGLCELTLSFGESSRNLEVQINRLSS